MLSSPEKEVKRPGFAITAAFTWKQNKYRGTFYANPTLLPLAVSMCRTLGSDTKALIRAMVVRRVNFQDDASTGQVSAVAEGREVAHLHRRFSFVL